ncbi:hypothetical protein [Bacillus sp. NPDC094106]|uniref:hypothetical protein n=1 Tax=Bacillus sp. NPDC094106 TaxID=3363949 RepID=UPI0037FD3732
MNRSMVINPLFLKETLCSICNHELNQETPNRKNIYIKKLRQEDFRIDSVVEEEIEFSCKNYKFLLSLTGNHIEVLTPANSKFDQFLINVVRDGLRKLFKKENVYV